MEQPHGVNAGPRLSTWVCVSSSTLASKDNKVLPQRATGRMEMEMKSLRAESCKDTRDMFPSSDAQHSQKEEEEEVMG